MFNQTNVNRHVRTNINAVKTSQYGLSAAASINDTNSINQVMSKSFMEVA